MDYNNNQQTPEPQTLQAQVPPVQPQPPQAMPMQTPITPQVPQGPPQRDDSEYMPYSQNYQPLEYFPPAKRKPNVGKIIGRLIAVALVLLGFYFIGTKTYLFSPGGKAKTYSISGFSIELPSEFVAKGSSVNGDIGSIILPIVFYESRESVISVFREDFSVFEQEGIKTNTFTLTDYAKLTMKANGISSSVKAVGNLTTFEYTKTVNSNNLTYFATVHKGSNAFWMVRFTCETKDYKKLKSKFEKWAKTIKID